MPVIVRRESLEDFLERLEELYQSGKYEKARQELGRARRKYPQDLTLLEWEATFLVEEGRHADALSHLEAVLAREPDRRFARREKCSALMGVGRFAEALALLEEIGPEDAKDAGHHFDAALCLDRLGRTEEADRAFRKAARLDSESFPKPARLLKEEFEAIVAESLDGVPETLRPYLENVVVEVMDYPKSPPLDPCIDPSLLGLYVGVPRTERSQEFRDNLDRIFIFKRNLEIEFPERSELKVEIRKTVIHEIAHHFGLKEEEMGEYA